MADPLRLFIESTHKFGHLSAATLTLCAHDRPFYGLHERLAQLREHHEERLQAAWEACDTPTHALDMPPVLFRRKLDLLQQSFAIGAGVLPPPCGQTGREQGRGRGCQDVRASGVA